MHKIYIRLTIDSDATADLVANAATCLIAHGSIQDAFADAGLDIKSFVVEKEEAAAVAAAASSNADAQKDIRKSRAYCELMKLSIIMLRDMWMSVPHIERKEYSIQRSLDRGGVSLKYFSKDDVAAALAQHLSKYDFCLET